MRFLKFFVIFLGLGLPAMAEDRLIEVTGMGQTEAVPDMATITLGVSQDAKNPADAMNAVSEGAAAVLAALEARGIEARDMQTSDLSLRSIWDHGPDNKSVLRGYRASNRVMVRVRDLKRLGEVVATATQEGANSFDGLSFGLHDLRGAQDAARKEAIADARAKAELYAGAAGVSLGQVISITETGSYSPEPRAMADMAMVEVASPPVAAGEIGISASVTVVFELVD